MLPTKTHRSTVRRTRTPRIGSRSGGLFAAPWREMLQQFLCSLVVFLGRGRTCLEPGAYSCWSKIRPLIGIWVLHLRRQYAGHSAPLEAQRLKRNEVNHRAQIRAGTAPMMGAKTFCAVTLFNYGAQILWVPGKASDFSGQRYQRGSVYQKQDKIKMWYGGCWEDIRSTSGRIERRQRKVRLGTSG